MLISCPSNDSDYLVSDLQDRQVLLWTHCWGHQRPAEVIVANLRLTFVCSSTHYSAVLGPQDRQWGGGGASRVPLDRVPDGRGRLLVLRRQRPQRGVSQSTLLLYHLLTTPWQVGGDGGPLRARAQRQGGGRRVGEGGGPRQLRPRGHPGGAPAPSTSL